MSIPALVLTLLSTLNAPATTGDVKAKEQPDQYFCCDWVDPSGGGGAGTGGGCVKTTEDNINGCANWLICPGGATGSDGVVTCTAPKKTEKASLQLAASDDVSTWVDDDAEFCCDSVESINGQPRGYGCTEVIADSEEEEIEILNSDECTNAIGCAGHNYTNDNGTVTCL